MNKAHVKISIIIISKNAGEYIKETITSILDQDYSAIEVIVIDDASNDGTVEVLKSFGDKIRWVSESDGGQGDAVVKGFKMSSGGIINIQSADDILSPKAISTVIEVFKNANISGIYGRHINIDEKGKIIGEPSKLVKHSLEDVLTRTFVFPDCSTFFRRELFFKCNLNDIKKLYLVPDFRYYLEMSLHTQFQPIDFVIVKQRSTPNGINVNPDNAWDIQYCYKLVADWFFNNSAVSDKYKTKRLQHKLKLRILLVNPKILCNVSDSRSFNSFFRLFKRNPSLMIYWSNYCKQFFRIGVKLALNKLNLQGV